MSLSTRRTPLLHCTNPHPLDVLDAGVRILPVLPLHRHRQRQKNTESDSQRRTQQEQSEANSQEAWAMTNERGRAPWFCANDIRCVLSPSSTLLPYMFDEAIALKNLEDFGTSNSASDHNFAGMVQQFDRKTKVDVIPDKKTNKSKVTSKRVNARALSRTSSSASNSQAAAAAASSSAAAAASSNAIATAAIHDMDEDMIDTQQSFPDLSSIPLPTFPSPDFDSPVPAAASASPVTPFSGLSVQSQMEYFERGLATKRLRSSEDPHTASKVPLSDRTSAGGRSTVGGPEFFAETSNHIPAQLMRQLLEEEQTLARPEEKEDLDGEKLAVIHVYPPSTPASVDSFGVAPAYALLPGGALLEELTLAAICADSNNIITPQQYSSSLTMNIVHSLSLDSTIRQILLTTPAPKVDPSPIPTTRASTDQADETGSTIQPPDHPILPLIVSRSTYQFYVHSIVFDSSTANPPLSSNSAPALVPSLFSIDYHCFRSPIVDMSSNPHIPNEVAILLQDGSIFVWNLFGVSSAEMHQIQWEKQKQDILHNRKPNQSPKKPTTPSDTKTSSQRKLTCFPPGCYLPPSASLQTPLRWGRILFAHTPRVLMLVLTNSIWQIDIRAPYQSTTHGVPCRGKQLHLPPLALKPFQSYSSPALREPDTRELTQARIYAASICPSNRFHLILVSSDFVLLCDTRHDGLRRPLLSWFHHQSGEPPAVIHWTSFHHGNSRQVNNGSCASCSQDDVYFFTNNRQRNEVTLYHYGMSSIPKPTIPSEAAETVQLHGSTSAFSSYTPIRLPSLLHAEQNQRSGMSSSSDTRADFDLPNPLVGLAILPSTALLHQPQRLANNVYHVMQLSKYGAVVTQSFQHLHDVISTATFATVVPLPGSQDDSSSTALNPNGYASPERKRSRQSLMVLVNEPNASSTSSSTSPNLSLSPTSAFKSSTTAALPPWIQTHELKPFHKVNLMNLVTAVTGKLSTPGTGPLKRLSPPRSSTLSSAPTPPVLSQASFTHFLASVIHSFSSSATLHAYLSLPKTLSEISAFVVRENVLDPLLLQSLIGKAPTSESQHKRNTRSSTTKTNSKDEDVIGARELHAVAQIVYSALHAFVFLYQQDSNSPHEPYHIQRWSKHLQTITDEDASVEPLDPSSPEFPQPSYPLFHFHLSLTRGKSNREEGWQQQRQQRRAKTEEEETEHEEKVEEERMGDDDTHASGSPHRVSRKRKNSSNLDFSTCHCSSFPTSVNDRLASESVCCCQPLCQCIHCLRLDACVYCTSPSVLHMAWPTPPQRGLTFDDAAAAVDSQQDRNMQVSLEPFQQGSSQLRTPHRHHVNSGGVLSSSPASLNGPTVDLSQDIGFLMSQSQSTETVNAQEVMRDSGNLENDNPTVIPSHDSKQFDSPAMNDDGAPVLDADESEFPPDPHALQEMLAGMATSWQRAEELAERLLRQRRINCNSALYSSSSSEADVDDSNLDVASIDAQLAELNSAHLVQCLVNNGLAVDPAKQSQAAEIGDDMRASMFDDMEDRGGGDGDD